MAHRPVDAVWFWPLTITPLRAVYGRLPGPYSKDYLQTSGDCSDVFDGKTGRQGVDPYPVTYRWPGGSTADFVRPGGGYNPPQDLRLNFRWPFSQAPAPWRLSMAPGPIAAFPGDPSKTTREDADAELARFLAVDSDPWLVAVKIRGEANVLHVRAYMGRPPIDRRYASLDSVPSPLLAEMRALIRGGCGTYVPERGGAPALLFDPDQMFHAWADAVAVVSPPPDVGVVITIQDSRDAESVLGVSIDLPAASAANLAGGLPFVYSAGSAAGDERTYFGTGIIGSLAPSPSLPGVVSCDLVGYRAFEAPVPYRTESGQYLEPDGDQPGYFGSAVRTVPISVLESIVAQSTLTAESEGVVAGLEAEHPRAYPTSEHSRRIDEYAMNVGEAEVSRRFPTAEIRRMPHNNPGYDIRASDHDLVVRYVEVKGTSGARGAFFLSEGERRFSERNRTTYSLCVVRNIDVDAQTHDVSWHDGEVDVVRFGLNVRQWQGMTPD